MKPTDHETVVKMLESVGFTELMRGRPVGSLSGGWKMKLALGECCTAHHSPWQDQLDEDDCHSVRAVFSHAS